MSSGEHSSELRPDTLLLSDRTGALRGDNLLLLLLLLLLHLLQITLRAGIN